MLYLNVVVRASQGLASSGFRPPQSSLIHLPVIVERELRTLSPIFITEVDLIV